MDFINIVTCIASYNLMDATRTLTLVKQKRRCSMANFELAIIIISADDHLGEETDRACKMK